VEIEINQRTIPLDCGEESDCMRIICIHRLPDMLHSFIRSLSCAGFCVPHFLGTRRLALGFRAALKPGTKRFCGFEIG